MEHRYGIDVSFGDCDPAGIIYYPNLFRWFDRCFHDWLNGFGGHHAVCGALGSIGLGLIDAKARFIAPMRPGDRLEIEMRITRWGGRSLSLAYAGRLGGVVAVEAEEVRGVFLETPDGLKAGEMAALKGIVEQGGV